MPIRYAFYLLFCLAAAIPASGQGIVDSVFSLQPVAISSARLFTKEEAGTKETRVDSLVLLEKINLSLSDVLAENTTVYIKDYGRGALRNNFV